MQTNFVVKFLADMGISQTTINWIREQQFDALHLRELNLHKLSDIEIIEKAKLENRIILTCDLDFGELMAMSNDILPSVIIFRLRNQSPININNHLSIIIKKNIPQLVNGAIIIVEENKHRIRSLPVKF